jgi:hypothetical protein
VDYRSLPTGRRAAQREGACAVLGEDIELPASRGSAVLELKDEVDVTVGRAVQDGLEVDEREAVDVDARWRGRRRPDEREDPDEKEQAHTEVVPTQRIAIRATRINTTLGRVSEPCAALAEALAEAGPHSLPTKRKVL